MDDDVRVVGLLAGGGVVRGLEGLPNELLKKRRGKEIEFLLFRAVEGKRGGGEHKKLIFSLSLLPPL